MATWMVLGANSFSGTAFVDHLLGRGEHAISLSRPAFDLNTRLEAIEAEAREHRPDYFVNFAALNMVGESWQHFPDYYRTNLVSMAMLAERLRKMRFLKRYVHISTPEVYGSVGRFLQEDDAFNPSTPYAVSRAAMDLHLMALYRARGFPVVFTRSVNVYGPGQQVYRIIPKTVLSILRGEKLKLHGGGVSMRSFVHIGDVSDAVYRVAVNGRAGECYHSSTERQTSIRRLVEMICERMGARFMDVVERGEERLGKDMAYQLDSGKIRRELGWRDRIGLDDGLDETVEWFRANAARFAGQSLEYTHRA